MQHATQSFFSTGLRIPAIDRLFAALATIFLLSLCSFSHAADPIKTLIVDGQNNHRWMETTPVLKEMMEVCGRFTVDVSTCPKKGEDMSGYQPDFAPYQLVVVNNGYGADAWPRKTEVAFEEFVAEGGGVVIYHAADNAWPDWRAYNEMIGIGGWGGAMKRAVPICTWTSRAT